MIGKSKVKRVSILFILALLAFLLGAPSTQAQQSSCRQQGSRQATLRSSAALTATASGSSVGQLQDCKQAIFVYDVTVASTGTADALNVYIQSSPDGTNWVDVVSFSQTTGSAALQRVARWTATAAAPTTPEEALQSSALTAGSVAQGPGGRLWRVRSVVSDTSPTGDSSWTFSVIGYFRD